MEMAPPPHDEGCKITIHATSQMEPRAQAGDRIRSVVGLCLRRRYGAPATIGEAGVRALGGNSRGRISGPSGGRPSLEDRSARIGKRISHLAPGDQSDRCDDTADSHVRWRSKM